MELKIALAQYPITYHSTFENWKNHTHNWVRLAVEKGAQLIVFPEYGAMELVSLFSKNIQSDLKTQLIEMQSLLTDFVDTFKELAKKYACILVAPSFPVCVEKKFVNRVYVFSAQNTGFQDKWFMTRFENENWGVSSISSILTVFETSFFKFGIQICYDIEFPIGSHLLCQNDIDLLLVPSCTDSMRGLNRVHVGAKARAMENQIYVAVSQTINHAEWSPAVDVNIGLAAIYTSPDINLPENGIYSASELNKECWLIETLDFQKNKFIQSKGQVLNRLDMQKIEMNFRSETVIKIVKL